MSFFSSGPPEVISRVFQSCITFADVLALATSCKRLKSIWDSNRANIIWHVGRTSILSFDDALIASWGRGAASLLDESPHLLQSWREGYHRATYRSIIAGAVLSRPYLAPFYENFIKEDETSLSQQDDDEEFMSRVTEEVESQNGDLETTINELPMTDRDLEIISAYPAYNFTPTPDWENCFGHLGDWLIKSTRSRLSSEQTPTDNPNSKEVMNEHTVLREIMQVLVVFATQLDIEGLPDRSNDSDPFWARHYFDSSGRCICESRRFQDLQGQFDAEEAEDSEEEEEGLVDEELRQRESSTEFQGTKQKTRKLNIISFGSFQMTRTFLISDVKEFDDDSVARPESLAYPERDWDAPEIPDIDTLCELLHCMSGRPNRINGHTAPHPPLHFFTFLLGKYFDYRFDDLAFEMDCEKPIYANFIRNGRVFVDSEECEWEGMLTSSHDEVELSYVQLGWANLIIE